MYAFPCIGSLCSALGARAYAVRSVFVAGPYDRHNYVVLFPVGTRGTGKSMLFRRRFMLASEKGSKGPVFLDYLAVCDISTLMKLLESGICPVTLPEGQAPITAPSLAIAWRAHIR
jgi:hypothetical protein